MKKASFSEWEEESRYIKINRRTFLKFSGFTGTLLGANQILGSLGEAADLSLQKSSKGAVEPKWVATSCLNCPARCALRVGTVNGKAIRVCGNPLSLVSDGKICPRGYIGLQVLYDRGRIDRPLKRTNKEKGTGIDPRWTPVGWNQALEEIAGRLQALAEGGQAHKLLLFSGLNSVSTEDFISRFSEAIGTPNLVPPNALDMETEKSGNWMATGHYSPTAYDLDQANYILAFGADMLEACKPVSRYLRKWGKLRREKPDRVKIVVLNPRYSVTAAKADEWLPVHPGTDAALAMGLANVIISEDLYDRNFVNEWTAGFEMYKQLALREYDLPTVAQITGIPPGVIQRLAREFAQTKPAIAIRGQEAINWPHGSYTSYAIFCLNALVGSIDVPGGVIFQEAPRYQEPPPIVEDPGVKRSLAQPRLDLRRTDKFPAAESVANQIPESILADVPYPVAMAMGFNSNFNMVAPAPERWEKALKKLPYYVHVSPFISEMAHFADLVLPSTTFLEEWGYDHSPPGSGFAEVKIKQPVARPLGEARSIIDILSGISKKLKGRVEQSLAEMGKDSKAWVKFRTRTLIPWEEFKKKGVWVGQKYEYRKYKTLFKTPSQKFEFFSGNLKLFKDAAGKQVETSLEYLPHHEEIRFLGKKENYPLVLLPYHPLLAVDNGSQNYPWAQEIFLPMHGIGWDTLLEINSQTAKALKLEDGREVWVESPVRKIKTRIKFSEGIHPEVVAIGSGQGHYSYGIWQKDIGVNPNTLIGVDYDLISGQAAFFNTRVKVYKA